MSFISTHTRPMGMGDTETSGVNVRTRAFGRSRQDDSRSLAAYAWGSDLPLGRLVVYSPTFIRASSVGNHDFPRTVALPDATGEYLHLNDGNTLDTDSALLAKFKVSGDYLVAGVVINGNMCKDVCTKERNGLIDVSSPVGEPDTYLKDHRVMQNREATIMHNGYAVVPIVTDIAVGDGLSFIDDPAGDPDLNRLGAFAKIGDGVQDLPENWKVIKGGKAGTFAEIYIGA